MANSPRTLDNEENDERKKPNVDRTSQTNGSLSPSEDGEIDNGNLKKPGKYPVVLYNEGTDHQRKSPRLQKSARTAIFSGPFESNGKGDQESDNVKRYIVEQINFEGTSWTPKFNICNTDFALQYVVTMNTEDEYLRIVASCRGLVCVATIFVHETMYVLNPSIANFEVRRIPNSTIPHLAMLGQRVRVGLGFDTENSVFKILRVHLPSDPVEAPNLPAEIFSLSENAWREIHYFPSYARLPERSFYFNNSIHWAAQKYEDSERCDTIVSFNLSDEAISEMSMPNRYTTDVEYQHSFAPILFEYHGCLSVYSKRESASALMWVMLRYGVSESWIEYSLPAPNHIDEAVCVGWNAEVIYKDSRFGPGTLIRNSLTNQAFRPCGFREAVDVWTYTAEYVPY